ncbi:MAG: MBL fold metallo-hydrolase [Oscillospiraceae bacterium]|nr:MBL fold metallo-hydrolase [Oscillospiraceae bacterium]
MKLTVLTDNNTYIDRYYLGEPALSILIEADGTNVLFDTGYSDVFIKNAEALGIKLAQTDYIVFSHGHDDHTKGLMYLEKADIHKAQIVAHPKCFDKKYVGDLYVGSPFDRQYIEHSFCTALSDKPLELCTNLWYLGEIPRVFDYENGSVGETETDGVRSPDCLYDDTALVYKSKKGLFIITGCSHSGICNITEYAKQVCGEDRIYGIIGGFHLFEDDKKLAETVKYFTDNKIEMLYPCHCVSLTAKHRMMEKLNVQEVGVSLVLEIE